MGRLSYEAKREKARNVLIETIAKINDLEPTLGGKWQENMVSYYVGRLAELLLYQAGFNSSSRDAIVCMETKIREVLTHDKVVG